MTEDEHPSLACPGSNLRWMTGLRGPVCPVCHATPDALGVARRRPPKTPLHTRGECELPEAHGRPRK